MTAKNIAYVLGVAATGLLLTMPAKAGIDPAKSADEIQTMAKNATSGSDHANVARHYRLRAEELEAKAKRHEEEARKLEKQPLPGMAYKWPAMVPRPAEKERRLAMQARRAANEASKLAARHLHLAVEAGLHQSAAERTEAPE